MSEQSPEASTNSSEPTPPEGTEQQRQQADEQPKTFDAEYVANLRKEAARYRTEAKANSEAAKKLAEYEEAKKTEAERNADRLRAAEEDAANARREALRFRIASKFKIDDEDADLFLTGSDEESITKQAERLVAREATRRAEADAAEAEAKRRGNHVPSEGTSPAASNANDLAFARDFFGAGG